MEFRLMDELGPAVYLLHKNTEKVTAAKVPSPQIPCEKFGLVWYRKKIIRAMQPFPGIRTCAKCVNQIDVGALQFIILYSPFINSIVPPPGIEPGFEA